MPSSASRIAAHQLQCADDARGARKLVERQEAQRVAHQHRDAGAERAGIGDPAMRDRPGGEAEIGLGLAAAGREEQQIDDLAVVVQRVLQARRG